MTTELVIFDLDGTLLNTISDLASACNYALQEMGFPTHPLQDYNDMVGNGFRKLIERAAPPESTTETIEKLITLSKGFYTNHSTDTTHPYPGIHELLKELTKRDIKIAVASNKYQEAVDQVITHYFPDIPFVSVQGQRKGRPIKPSPAIIEDILSMSQASKENVIMVGDSTVDIETAKRAKVTGIAVKWGFRPESELMEAFPDYIVSTPAEILNLLSYPSPSGTMQEC